MGSYSLAVGEFVLAKMPRSDRNTSCWLACLIESFARVAADSYTGIPRISTFTNVDKVVVGDSVVALM